MSNAKYKWKPYSVEYDTPEGRFSFTIYAISFEHAELIIQDIKQSLKLSGELVK